MKKRLATATFVIHEIFTGPAEEHEKIYHFPLALLGNQDFALEDQKKDQTM